MGLVKVWLVSGSDLIGVRFGSGLSLLLVWLGPGSGPVCACFGSDWVWFESGLDLVWVWLVFGLGLVRVRSVPVLGRFKVLIKV